MGCEHGRIIAAHEKPRSALEAHEKPRWILCEFNGASASNPPGTFRFIGAISTEDKLKARA
jgi:hypothetical protein